MGDFGSDVDFDGAVVELRSFEHGEAVAVFAEMADSSFMCQLLNCRLHAQGGRDGVEEDLLSPRWKQSRQIENERQLGCNLNVGTGAL